MIVLIRKVCHNSVQCLTEEDEVNEHQAETIEYDHKADYED